MTNHYHLPSGNGYGWGVCGSSLSDEFDSMSLHGVTVPPFSSMPICVDGGLIEAVEGVSGLPVHKYIWPSGLRVGYAFIEDDIMFQNYAPNLKLFDHLVCGSSYMEEELKASGSLSFLKQGSSYAIQGVDSSKFFYDPNYVKPTILKDKFVFGSFGKFEFRKGQDIVIKAFSELAKKRDDVVLLCNWYNPWPETAKSMAHSQYLHDNSIMRSISEFYAGNWDTLQYRFYEDLLRSFGLKNNQFIVMRPSEHNSRYADQYRACDTCVFPNRKEAGTNLPLMEALACGSHCVYTDAHGHSDISQIISGIMRDVLFKRAPVDLLSGYKFVHTVGLSSLGNYFETPWEQVFCEMNDNYDHPACGLKDKSHLFSERLTWKNTATKLASPLEK